MARQVIAAQTIKKPHETVAANSLNITETAANTTDKESAAITGGELLLIHNTHATNPYTVTINSTADALNRTGDINAYSVPATRIAMVGPFQQLGWGQSGADANKLFFEAENTAIKYAWLKVAS